MVPENLRNWGLWLVLCARGWHVEAKQDMTQQTEPKPTGMQLTPEEQAEIANQNIEMIGPGWAISPRRTRLGEILKFLLRWAYYNREDKAPVCYFPGVKCTSDYKSATMCRCQRVDEAVKGLGRAIEGLPNDHEHTGRA